MRLQKYFGFSVQGLGQFQGLFASYSLHRLPFVPDRLEATNKEKRNGKLLVKLLILSKIIFKWSKIISALIIVAHQAASLYCPGINGHALFGLKIVTR
jgi:hypothetical protein